MPIKKFIQEMDSYTFQLLGMVGLSAFARHKHTNYI